jgi:hypothetical protein
LDALEDPEEEVALDEVAVVVVTVDDADDADEEVLEEALDVVLTVDEMVN